MERRLKLAGQLLNPTNSVLVVTIDERESNRLGLLLEQTFPQARMQMVSTLINPKGVSTNGGFRRADEYIYFLMFGAAKPARLPLGVEWSASPKASTADGAASEDSATGPGWTSMMRRGSNSARKDRPSMFYPIYADPEAARIREVGDPLPPNLHEAPERPGLVTILPIRRNGSEGRWQVAADELRSRIEQGRVRLGRRTSYGYVVNYLPDGAYAEVLSDRFQITGRAADGSLVAVRVDGGEERVAPSQWKLSAHNSSEHGSSLLANMLPGRKFPFPKSLYAVEDTLRFFIHDKPDAVVLDFFAGSGTTAHAVMRLNKQDQGRRQCISVTNNEVSAEEQDGLRADGLRPGDPDWEALGICDHITKPRLAAAISGTTHNGEPVKGDYKFTDGFPMADGLNENVEFFTLTYETPWRVARNRDFEKIAPLLWLRAGSRGRRIDTLPADGWDVADTYGVIAALDRDKDFQAVIAQRETVTVAFIVTDDDRRFQIVAAGLPERVEPVRLYESYLNNFEINTGRE